MFKLLFTDIFILKRKSHRQIAQRIYRWNEVRTSGSTKEDNNEQQHSFREFLWSIADSRNLQEKTKRIWKNISTDGFSKGSNRARVFNSTSVGRLRYIFPPFRWRRSFPSKFLGNFHRGEGRPEQSRKSSERSLRVVTFSEWGTTEEGRSPIANRNKRKDNPARTRRRTSRLIALIFFVSHFATSYPSPFLAEKHAYREGKCRERKGMQGVD